MEGGERRREERGDRRVEGGGRGEEGRGWRMACYAQLAYLPKLPLGRCGLSAGASPNGAHLTDQVIMQLLRIC